MSNRDNSIYKEANSRGLKTVSYSQFNLFSSCPYSWYKQYVEKIRIDSKGIDMLFGSAFHDTFQTYLQIYFTKTIREADALDLNKILNENMLKRFKEMAKDGDTSFTTKDELSSYFLDGVDILAYLKRNKQKYFDKSKYELVGTEVPLLVPIDEGINKLAIVSFLDVVLKEKSGPNHLIIDLKTSYMGWKKNKKNDFITKSQLLFYKKYYAKLFNISEKNITTKFFVVKRKVFINESMTFKPGRVQQIEPASGTTTMKKFDELFGKFLKIFDENGQIKSGLIFNKASSKKACTYCNYKNTIHCDRKNK
ncbi:PD-(D/E)XK nuclease family protein [Candidatus Gracilibacteria bacterium]|jgi:hypothetical protein|nr:PD-(D/E)XK nuclease family protein [Candidatus Gracilibacteria bacterium]